MKLTPVCGRSPIAERLALGPAGRLGLRLCQSQQAISIVGLTPMEWLWLSGWSALVGKFAALFYHQDRLLVFAGYATASLILLHMAAVSRKHVTIPGVIAFSAALQWLVGPLVAVLYPPTLIGFERVTTLHEYLGYALPATVAFWIGLHLPIDYRRLSNSMAAHPLPPRMKRLLDISIAIGMVLAPLAQFATPSLAAALYMIASLRFSAVLIWMISRMPGWRIRFVVVFVHMVVIASADGVFHLMIQWSCWFAVLYAFRERWKWRIAVVVCAGLLAASVIQYIKAEYRSYLFTEEPGAVDRIHKMASLAWEHANGTASPIAFGDIVVRFDQGWIMSRVIARVPAEVPYAQGGTILEALKYCFIPRVLDPDKPSVASHSLFFRYTGVELDEWTSMTLSVAGEMYANFGWGGGVAGTFVVGYALGFVFSIAARIANKNQFCWAIIPNIMLASVEPTWNISDILNETVKCSMLVLAICVCIPPARVLLMLPRTSWRPLEVLKYVGLRQA